MTCLPGRGPAVLFDHARAMASIGGVSQRGYTVMGNYSALMSLATCFPSCPGQASAASASRDPGCFLSQETGVPGLRRAEAASAAQAGLQRTAKARRRRACTRFRRCAAPGTRAESRASLHRLQQPVADAIDADLAVVDLAVLGAGF